MGETYTDHLIPRGMKQWENDTSVDFGNNFRMRIPNQFANLLEANVGADITYDEWQGRDGKTRYTITAVNGQKTRQQRQQQQRSGGPAARSSGGGGPAARAQAKAAPAASGGGRQSDWDVMGPENRARFAAKDVIVARYRNEKLDLPGDDALAAEFSMVYHAWLRACEGRNLHAGDGRAELDEALDGDSIPDGYAGPQDESEYVD